jgi:3-oxoacyl-[acyl-carrier-protein] synthase-1
MSRHVLALRSSGLVTSVGLTSAAACAAIRAKLTNPSVTRFIPPGGEPLVGHQVELDTPVRGVAKLVQMAAMAIEETLAGVPRDGWPAIPLLLCVAEPGRPGRVDGLDEALHAALLERLGARFADGSAIVAHGRVSLSVALAQARKLIHQQGCEQVLIAAADSLLNWPTLSVYASEERLLTPLNSNGFIPGEAAGAVLLAAPRGKGELRLDGLGFAVEKAHIDSGEPLRGDGLTSAMKAALAEAGCDLFDIDYRVSDLSGEQYYFKEASLALNRILRKRREEFELWHPAECIGEAGAAAGFAGLAVIHAAHLKGYAPGPRSLLHLANDSGARAAITTHVS